MRYGLINLSATLNRPRVRTRQVIGRPIRRRRGVTLLEIVLAMALLVTLTTMTYWFYSSALDTRARGNESANKLRLMRAFLDRIGTEIRQASAITTQSRVGLRGDAERIWLFTQRVPSRETAEILPGVREPVGGESDLVKIEYKIARHPDILHDDGYEYPLGLARVELLIPRADSAQSGEADAERGRRTQVRGTARPANSGDGNESGGQDTPPVDEALLDQEFFGGRDPDDENDARLEIQWEELYAPEILFLRFCYYDGANWWDDWDVSGENPLPQLVQVTAGFVPHPPFEGDFVPDEVKEFCECLNREPSDCLPLMPDQFSTMVRVPQADTLFRSRITRETQDFVQQSAGTQ